MLFETIIQNLESTPDLVSQPCPALQSQFCKSGLETFFDESQRKGRRKTLPFVCASSRRKMVVFAAGKDHDTQSGNCPVADAIRKQPDEWRPTPPSTATACRASGPGRATCSVEFGWLEGRLPRVIVGICNPAMDSPPITITTTLALLYFVSAFFCSPQKVCPRGSRVAWRSGAEVQLHGSRK